MPTDPLTDSRYPDSGYAPNVPQDIQNAVFDLADNTVVRATSTTTRDTKYTNYVAAGGAMANGMVCYTGADDTIWRRSGGTWKLWARDEGWQTLSPNSPWVQSTNGSEYRVKDNYVDFTVHITRTTSWTGPIALWTFPTGARPTRKPWYYHAAQDVAAGGTTISNVTVATSGVATFTFSGAANDKIAVSGRFPID